MTNNPLSPTLFKTFTTAQLQKVGEGPISSRSDEALVELCQAGLRGADEAFEELAQRYKDLVLNRCARIIGLVGRAQMRHLQHARMEIPFCCS